MTDCEGCGRPTMPDESGLCDRCLATEWRELRRGPSPISRLSARAP
jgi:hypothetical protein